MKQRDAMRCTNKTLRHTQHGGTKGNGQTQIKHKEKKRKTQGDTLRKTCRKHTKQQETEEHNEKQREKVEQSETDGNSDGQPETLINSEKKKKQKETYGNVWRNM